MCLLRIAAGISINTYGTVSHEPKIMAPFANI